MARMNGERPQDFLSRRQWQIQAAIATRAKELEYEVMRANHIPLPVIPVPPACTCDKWPFAHFHEEDEVGRIRTRFRKGFAPLYGPDGHVIEPGPHVAYFAGGNDV